MKNFLERYKQALALNRWPVLTPEELRKAEQKKKLDRLKPQEKPRLGRANMATGCSLVKCKS